MDERRTDTREQIRTIALELFAEHGYDKTFGARPMARLVERVIKKPLSEILLFGSLADGGTLQIGVDGDEIRLQAGAADADPAGA